MIARHFIDSLDFAYKGKELSGEIPVAEMLRLEDVLASSEGRVSYVLRGLQDKNGTPMLELALNGQCQLRCQRCLQGMAYTIHQSSHLTLADEAPDGLDADDVDSIPPDPHLDVVALVEDEILLNLPFAPKHELGSCEVAEEGLAEDDRNPFAILLKLKDK